MNKPTDEQIDIIECDSNSVVIAKPGSGKTFTVVEKMLYVSKKMMDFQGVIAISFTNKASDELKLRCRKKNINLKQSFLGTIDKFFISEIIIPFASHLANEVKIFKVEENINDTSYQELANIGTMPTAVQEEKLIASLKEGKIFLNICGETAWYILKNVPQVKIYLKSKFKYIFIDEYQDCGLIQHKIFMELVSNGICGCAVGDIDQAIYGFANKSAKYLELLTKEKSFKNFSITKNYRCHESVANYSLALKGIEMNAVSELRVFKVNVVGNENDIAKKIDNKLSILKTIYKVTKNNKCAILCKNNSTAKMINNALKTPHKLYTDTDLDKNNSNWARLFCEILNMRFNNEFYAIDFVEKNFDEYLDYKKYNKVLHLSGEIFECKKENLYQMLDQFIEIAILIYPNQKNEIAVQLLQKVTTDETILENYIPSKDDEINIMTIHKSKGLEFNIVFHMDLYEYIFPRYRCTDEEYTQNLNLHYVGITRAIDACFIIIGTERYRTSHDDYINAQESPFLRLPTLEKLRKNIR